MRAKNLIATGTILLAITLMSFVSQSRSDSTYSAYKIHLKPAAIESEALMAELNHSESMFTEEEVGIESWMTSQFAYEREVGIEFWMTRPFIMEEEVGLESWMTEPFLPAEEISVESWMTASWL